MQECIVVTSGKGGVGKSTVSTNMAVRLARSGAKVALLDADIGLRNIDLLLGMEQRIEWDLVQFVQGRCDLADVVMPVGRVPKSCGLGAVCMCKNHPFSALNPSKP